MGSRGTALNVTVDNSVFLAWCLAENATVSQTFERLLDDQSVHIMQPALWPYELVNALRTAERRERIAEPQSLIFLNDLGALPIRLEDGFPFDEAPALLFAAREFSTTAYDAAYIHFCLRAESALWTLDAGLRSAAEVAGITTLG